MKNRYYFLIFFVLFVCLCVFWVQFKFWEGWHDLFEKEKKSELHRETFLPQVQNVSGVFLQGPQEILYQKYQDFLSQTSENLQLETYEFTSSFFKDQFKQLLHQGKKIQIIIEDQKYQQYSNPIKQLESDFSWYQGIEFKSDNQMGTTYTHSKITLNEKWAWIQTANLTKSSYEQNREHFFYTENAEILKNLQELFSGDRNGSPLAKEDLHPNLVVCPQNCREIIELFLNNAQEEILIQTQYITDLALLDILKQQFSKVKMRFLVADTDDNTDLVEYFGPWIARKFTQFYNHTKMILIDRKYLILGSMNLSQNSLDNNREIWIILIDPQCIDEFLVQFERDWEKMKLF